ncbi:MAG TPA: hypothetical protein VM531_11100 [Sphingomicrobium sp.]|jgi:hypothetical protein|nr:hypothetical protein [Sphingomicrobium sp.]
MSILSNAVAILDSVTQSLGLQSEVVHFHWTSQSDDGVKAFTPAAGTKRKATWDKRVRIVAGLNGQQVTSTSSLIFPRPIDVDARDEFTLPDGKLGLIVSLSGFGDPVTKKPFATEVFLG